MWQRNKQSKLGCQMDDKLKCEMEQVLYYSNVLGYGDIKNT